MHEIRRLDFMKKICFQTLFALKCPIARYVKHFRYQFCVLFISFYNKCFFAFCYCEHKHRLHTTRHAKLFSFVFIAHILWLSFYATLPTTQTFAHEKTNEQNLAGSFTLRSQRKLKTSFAGLL